MAEIILKNVTKTYKGGTQAVKGINFTVRDKEFVVLVGPSGCGKSTTLRMIAGLEEISDGSLLMNQKKVNDLPPKDRKLSMVFQNYALYPHMTAYENMAFGLKINKLAKSEIKTRIAQAANILNIEDLLHKKPGQMSGGQRQRIAIGRAIVRRPQLFLFDEPLSNLDAELRTKMRIEIAKLHKKLDATIIYVTHDQVEAMTLGDKIIVMRSGEIMQMDSPMDLYLNPKNKFVAGFIGTPAMNFLEGKIIAKNNALFFKRANWEIDLSALNLENLAKHEGEKVSLGIRSEDVYPVDNQGICMPIQVLVLAIELLGSEKLIYAEHDGKQLIAKFPIQEEVKTNTNIDFYYDIEKVYLFDEEEKRIY